KPSISKILSAHANRPRGSGSPKARVAHVRRRGQPASRRSQMNKAAFLRIVRDGLAGLPAQDIDEILCDYSAYFDEGLASGRSEEHVAEALGDPRRLARELRAETGLRRWENHRSLRNSATVLLALGGLAAVDILFLLPLLFAVMLTVLVVCLVIFVLGMIGIGALLSVFKIAQFASIS